MPPLNTPFKTIRQRRRRARKGQVSAVAVLLGLLIVVSFIANYIAEQLPAEMSGKEFQHITQVENQLSRLQATILAEALNPMIPLTLSTPVTLGSDSVPPFGQPVQGTITPEPLSAQTFTHFSISQEVPNPPNWNAGNNVCASGSGPTCTGNGLSYFWNSSNVNNTPLTVKITGTSDTLVYNFAGSNDTITFNMQSSSPKSLQVVVKGSDNSVTFVKSGPLSAGTQTSFLFYGQRDVMNVNPSAATGGSLNVNVTFVGSLTSVCPFGNLSSTDKIGALSAANSGGLNVSFTWWNSVGYASAPNLETYPGASVGQNLIYTNQTGFIPCAYTKSITTSYSSLYQGGLSVHLANRYTPAADVAYDQGAVVLAEQRGNSVMVSPPSINVTSLPSGVIVSLTLVNLIMNLSTASGYATSALTTHVLSVHHLAIHSGNGGFFLSSPFYLNLTTPYPSAWMTYFSSLNQIFPSNAQCTPFAAIPPPYTCLLPPPGTVVKVSAPIVAQSLILTDVTVALVLN